MMGTRIPLKSGDEHDALTRARRYYKFRPGARASTKRRFWKRVRSETKRIEKE